MVYKPYGKTGMNVSALGFGGMRFDISRDLQANADLLHYAFSKGVTYFDTAPSYCDGQSVLIFGQAFKHMRGEYYVSTKKMPSEKDTPERTMDIVKKACETLNRDCIDVFHIWCIRTDEEFAQAMRPGGLYEGLLKAQSEGLVREIAFSSHQSGERIRKCFQQAKFGGVLLGMNVLNFPFRWDGVEAAAECGAGVVVMNPLFGGMIPKFASKLDYLAEDGDTPVRTALRFAIGTKQISSAIVGFTDQAQIDEACGVADAKEVELPPERLERIRKHLSPNLNEACTGCFYCENCPQGIVVPRYMLYYNPHHVFGVSEADMKAGIHGEAQSDALAGGGAKASACIACGQCEKVCTQHLPIVERLAKIAGWEG